MPLSSSLPLICNISNLRNKNIINPLLLAHCMFSSGNLLLLNTNSELANHLWISSMNLIDVQHSRKAVFSFEKGLNHQNHSSDSLYLVKYPPSKISNYPHTLPLFGNPCSRTIDTPPNIYGFSDKFIRK